MTPRAYRTRRSAPRARRRHGAATGRRGRPCRGLLARGRLRHAFLPRRQGRASEDPLSRPHAGERQGHTEGAAQAKSHISGAAPRRQDRRYRRAAADNWTFLETLSPETEVIDFWHACEHLRASDHAVALRLVREVPRGSANAPDGVDKVIGVATFVIAQSGSGRDRTGTRLLPQVASACATTP